MEAVEEFGKSGAKLLVTIDCGIADVKEVERLNELGIDVIITDHHELSGATPPAFAILNSKQTDCFYPEKDALWVRRCFQTCTSIDRKKRSGLANKRGGGEMVFRYGGNRHSLRYGSAHRRE